MEEHVIEFNQLAMTHAQGSDVMLNRVMTKGSTHLLKCPLWPTLAHFGPLWPTVAHSGPLCLFLPTYPTFAYFGPLLLALARFGHFLISNDQRYYVLSKIPFFAYFCPFFPYALLTHYNGLKQAVFLKK